MPVFFKTADIQALLTQYQSQGYKPFDAQAYTAKYLTGHPAEPVFPTALEHFLAVGAAAGYNPLGNAVLQFFNASFYANKYPNLAIAGVTDPGDLFGHYLLYGIGEGRQASDVTNNFDSTLYLTTYPQVAQYVNSHLSDFLGSASNGALAHFTKFGADQGFTGFTLDPATNDHYNLDHLLSVQSKLTLIDNPSNDRDTLIVANAAIDYKEAGVNTICLEILNNGLAMDFDVLDIRNVTGGNLLIRGDSADFGRDVTSNLPGSDADDLIVGNLKLISSVIGFQDLWLTDESIASSGTFYRLETYANSLVGGNNSSLFEVSVRGINASLVTQGIRLESQGNFAPTYLVGSAHNDSLRGGGGDDVLEGGAGQDFLDGGISAERYVYQLWGKLGGEADAKYTITIDGVTQVLTETFGANPDNLNQVEAGASNAIIGAALAKLINAHLGNNQFNSNPLNGMITDAIYIDTDIEGERGHLLINYLPGIDAPEANTTITQSAADAENPQQLLFHANHTGGVSTSDTFVFHHGDSTLVQVTADVVNDFGNGPDILRFFNPDGTVFLGIDAGNGINYVEAAGSNLPAPGGKVANFAEALTAANTALAVLNANVNASAGALVSFQYDATNGYVFQDTDGNGVADQVVILIGVDSTEIDHFNFGYELG